VAGTFGAGFATSRPQQTQSALVFTFPWSSRAIAMACKATDYKCYNGATGSLDYRRQSWQHEPLDGENTMLGLGPDCKRGDTA